MKWPGIGIGLIWIRWMRRMVRVRRGFGEKGVKGVKEQTKKGARAEMGHGFTSHMGMVFSKQYDRC